MLILPFYECPFHEEAYNSDTPEQSTDYLTVFPVPNYLLLHLQPIYTLHP